MRRLDQTEGEVYKELMWHYFDSVERLYTAGARAFAFHLLVPFDRARIGVDSGPLVQAQTKVCSDRAPLLGSLITPSSKAYNDSTLLCGA